MSAGSATPDPAPVNNTQAYNATVTPLPPAANNDTAATPANTPVTIPALGNDKGGGGAALDPATIDLDPSTPGQQTTLTVPNEGTFTANPNGTVTFTPVPGFNGVVTVPYTVQDSAGQTSNPANITITVAPPATPAAQDDSATTAPVTAVTLPALGNDAASAGNTLVPASVDLDPSTPAIDDTITNADGTWTVNTATGAVTFTPAAGFTGVATLPYTVQDSGGGTSNIATLTVTVADPAGPTAANDNTSTPAGTPVTLNPAANDTPPAGNTLDPTSIDLDPTTPGQDTTVTTPQGTWTLDLATGVVTFTPAAGFTGTATLPYTIEDNTGALSNPANLTVVVNPAGTPPTAVPDATTTPLNTPVTLTPATNDAAAPGAVLDPATIDLDPVTPGQQTTLTTAQGAWTLDPATGQVTFTPVNNFTGTATIPYTIQDSLGQTSAPANLSVTIGAPPPTAANDSAATPLNTPVIIDVPGNDSAAPGAVLDPASIDLDPATPGQQTTLAVPGQGTFTLNSTTGQVTFTPATGFAGTASIPYTIEDSLGQVSNPATITVIINTPAANPDSAVTPLNTPVTLNPLVNDIAGAGETLVPGSIDLDPATPGQQTTFTVPNQGTFTLNPTTGAVTFTPVTGFTGTATIPYTVQDSSGDTSNPANLSVTVTPGPAANDDSATTPLNTPVTLNPPANDVASSGATLTPGSIDLDPGTAGQQTTFTVPGQGTFTLNPATGAVTFTPVNGFTGTVIAPYTIQDSGGGTSNPATLTVTIAPAPTANPDSTTTAVNTPATLTPATNDSASPGQTLVPGSIDLDPSTPGQQTSQVTPQGTWTLNPATGVVTFTPVTGFTGTATLPYTIQDSGGGTSNPSTLTVTVSGSSAGPTATNDSAFTPLNTPVTLNPVANDSPSAGAALDLSTIDLDPATPGQQTTLTVPNQGTFTLNPLTGQVTFTPVTGFAGTASIPYTIEDSSGQTSNPATITVTINTPAANNDSATTPLNTPVTLDPLVNDIAGSGETLVPGSIDLDPATPGQQTTFTVPGQGTFTLNPTTGAVTFTPVAGFTGTASIPYTIQDSSGDTSNPATLTVTVTPGPAANDDSATTPLNTPVTLNPPANDVASGGATLVPGSIDLDPATPGQQTTFTVPGQGTFTLNPATGAVTFTPVAGFTGTVIIPYAIQDSTGATSNPADLTVTVAGASVTGHVFNDSNGNGVQDPGEPNLAGVIVILTSDGCRPGAAKAACPVVTVTTDVNGNYTAVVTAGSVTATVSTPDGTIVTTANNPQTIIATAGQIVTATPVGFGPGTPIPTLSIRALILLGLLLALLVGYQQRRANRWAA